MLRFNEKWLGLRVLVVPGSEAVSRTHLSRLVGNDRIGHFDQLPPTSPSVGWVKGPSPRRSCNSRDAPKTGRAAAGHHADG
jgi:hypothetical protein